MSSPSKILLINHDPEMSEKVRAALADPKQGPFELKELHLLQEGLDKLRDGSLIAAVLFNPQFSDGRGIEYIKHVLRVAPSTPLLILGREDQESFAFEAMSCGAQDYILPNNLNNYSLPSALRNAVGRKSIEDALYVEKERALVTLNSIGDAVLCTNASGEITFLNRFAEKLTGWSKKDAVGKPLVEVFKIIDGITRMSVPDPLRRAIELDRTLNLPPNCILIRRDKVEAAIEDSSAPIHDRAGQVIGAVIVFHDVTAARAMANEMARAAHYDTVTELPNRLLLNDRISHAITTARRHGQMFAVMFVDLDHFKSINDSLGHAIGDKLLHSVARRLQASVRESDTVGRHGGDEFIILLPDITDEKGPEVSTAKIIASLSAPYIIDDITLQTTATIGISIYPQDGTDADTLIQNADLAMYQGKGDGRDRAHFFSEKVKAQAIERQFVESGLRRALEQNEFVLHYQPKVNLNSGKITGAEALIRWQEPARGLILPCQFISVAESRGMIISIGRWVLREVCRQALAWGNSGIPLLPISINISAAELRDVDFIRGVQSVLKETGLNPTCLEFELTEGILLKDLKISNSVLNELKDMGIHVAVDDFGTGYSSLSYLHQFAIDILKIDQSFVQHITADPKDSTLVSAMIAMAKGLKYRIIAEGIETERQREFFHRQGCEEGQGYLFSRPLPPIEFRSFLTSQTALTSSK